MPEFQPNVPVVQEEPNVTVEINRERPLPIGAHRFSLVVTDDAGNESQPAFIDVVVRDTDRPTAVIDVVDPNGGRVEPVVSAGQPFILSGARSSDLPPGRIRSYTFTLLPQG